MSDLHVRRTASDYADVFAGLLPTGPAWPRDSDSVLMQVVNGLMGTWAKVDGRIADLLETESDPRLTSEMLSDWETAFGLPDPCVAEPLTLVDRHKVLLNRMTTEGGQSRDFFIKVAAALGYAITIREYSPFMAGISRAGDTSPVAPRGPADSHQRWMVGPSENRFYWTVYVTGVKTRWFRAGSGQAGIDPMVRIGLATDLECLLRRWKPAHTEVIFNYANASVSGTNYTWFRAGLGHAGVDPMVTITSTGDILDT